MNGLLLALFSALTFAFVNILIRRAMFRSGDAYSGVVITLFLGTLVFGAWVLISGQSIGLESFSWLGVGSLALAGIVHFIAGRAFSYNAIRIVGSNRAIPVQTSYILIAAILGIVFFGEPLTLPLGLALVLVVGGIIILSRGHGASTEAMPALSGRSRVRGISYALGTAVCWGVSPVLIKFGLEEFGSAALATFISGLAATVIIGLTLFLPQNRRRLLALDRITLGILTLVALATAVAQIARYVALDFAVVSTVVPLSGTYVIFFYPLSFMINRQIEDFSRRVIVGGICVITGVFLIFLGN